MPRKKAISHESELPPLRPATTPEARESQLIALAVDCAEKQLRDGTASSQVICHYLKLGSTRAKVELELLEKQRDLASAKTEAIRDEKKAAEMFAEAMRAMAIYSGEEVQDDY